MTDEEPIHRLESAIADLEARARDLDPAPDEPEPDEPDDDGDLDALQARLADDGPTPVEAAPVRAGLEVLLDLRMERELTEGTAARLDAAEATVVELQDGIQALADLFRRYRRDTARPETAAPVEPMATPTEPETEGTEVEPTAASTKRRLARLAVVLVATAVLSPVLTGVAPVGSYAVATGSMAPEIPRGGLVWTEAAEPAVGDVIVYESHLGRPTVHRVTDVRTSGGTTYYRTQGDANPSPDAFAVPSDRVHGVVVGSLPLVGNLWMIDLQTQAVAFAALVGAYVALTVASDRTLRARIRDAAPGGAGPDPRTA